MKKILNYFVMGAVAVMFSAALASCQKESANDKTSTPETPAVRVIHVDLSANVADTKATYSYPNVTIENGDKLYVALTGPESAWTATGTLTYATDKFSGDIDVTGTYEGTDPITDAKDLTATFLPDGYSTVGYLSATGVATAANAFYAGAKDAAVPQLVHLTASVTDKVGVAKSPLTLVPQNAVLCYSIDANKLTAGAHDVSVSNGTSTISGSVTAVADAATTFAVAFPANATPTDYTLGVTWYGKMVKNNKMLAAGHVVNISVSAFTPYVFSVSSTLTVKFSPGNLQYKASTNTWRFAEQQWDYVGSNNASASSTYNGWVDLFGWGTSGHLFASGYGSAYQPWSQSNINTDYGPTDGTSSLLGSFAEGDWGVNMGAGWRTLTEGENGEWNYLLTTRTGNRYCKATVNTVAGMVIFPDSYLHPAGVTAVASANTAEAEFTTNSWEGTAWTQMETAGAVFLPAAGYRSKGEAKSLGTNGRYWSSKASGVAGKSYYVNITTNELILDPGDRNRAYSVRLVQNQE